MLKFKATFVSFSENMPLGAHYKLHGLKLVKYTKFLVKTKFLKVKLLVQSFNIITTQITEIYPIFYISFFYDNRSLFFSFFWSGDLWIGQPDDAWGSTIILLIFLLMLKEKQILKGSKIMNYSCRFTRVFLLQSGYKNYIGHGMM